MCGHRKQASAEPVKRRDNETDISDTENLVIERLVYNQITLIFTYNQISKEAVCKVFAPQVMEQRLL